MTAPSLVIHDLFRAVAAAPENAERIAVRCNGRTWSYRELDERSDALAAAIHRAGVSPGGNVAILVTRSAEIIVSMLGILKAGCAFVPIDGTYPAAVVRDYIARSKAAAVVVVAGCEAAAETISGIPRLSLHELEPAPPPAAVDAGPDTPAYVMFTSGTTGDPKGVVVPHRGVVRLVRDTNYIAFHPEDNVLQLSPVTFDASTLEIWGALLNGATLVVYGEHVFDPNELAKTIRDNRVSILWLTAGLFHLIARHALDALEGVSVLLAGGDVIQPDAVRRVFERFPRVTFINGYGPTENTTFTCCHVMTSASPIGETIPIGHPITGTTVHVLDAERRPVARGEVGELYTGGLGVALGYLNAPEATRAAFVDDPERPHQKLYRTGDLVREMPDGAIDFLGRADNLVKVRGYRVSTTEIQKKINQIDGVENAVVAAVDDGTGSRCLVAYVQSSGEPRKIKQLVKGTLEETLPQYMVPSVIHVRATFPLNENGKVDARSLVGATKS
ncbi:amino acid adenylation domain-containing protein [Pendulispora albinea]|uniref:Amino acid adenylation domain-containing protein n=1 Tax=Pendulispora albinea TaxID=2741071 RepID=A0ABZ2M123_9BACT